MREGAPGARLLRAGQRQFARHLPILRAKQLFFLFVGDHVGDVSETKLTERQRIILILIKASPSITAKQMSETLSVSQRTIERDLSAMQKIGVLKREGKDNDGLWIVLYQI